MTDLQTTIWISRFLGPVILVLSIPMVTSPKRLQETTREFLADGPLVLVSGVLAMVAGLSIVNSHHVWVFDWPVIVTLFGWALVVGGAIRIAAPALVNDVGGSMMDRPTTTRVVGIVWGLLGAFLCFKGYG
jgi:hypothetical protein